jgi:ApaG protein
MPPMKSDATTQGVQVQAVSQFISERSSQEEGYFFFGYRIRITNVGSAQPVQLISRHWVITDGNGSKQEVRGPGVVGRQPRLCQGEAFEYSSFCPLGTPVGSMHGSYKMVGDDGEEFDAVVAPFTLAVPNVLN